MPKVLRRVHHTRWVPMSIPIVRKEIFKSVRFDYFNVRNIPSRLNGMHDDPSAFLNKSRTISEPMSKTPGAND
jgi:hypothetical protein